MCQLTARSRLRENGDTGFRTISTDNRDHHALGLESHYLCGESVGSHAIQRRYTEDTTAIENSKFFVHLDRKRNQMVYGAGG